MARKAEPETYRQYKIEFVRDWASAIKNRAKSHGVTLRQLDEQLGCPEGAEKSNGRAWLKYVRGDTAPALPALKRLTARAFQLGYLGFLRSLMEYESADEFEARMKREREEEDSFFELYDWERCRWSLEHANEIEQRAAELIRQASNIRVYQANLARVSCF